MLVDISLFPEGERELGTRIVDLLKMQLMLEGKGLAGYTTTPSRQHLAFALYHKHLEIPDAAHLADTAGDALGAIAAAAYSLPIDKPTTDAP